MRRSPSSHLDQRNLQILTTKMGLDEEHATLYKMLSAKSPLAEISFAEYMAIKDTISFSANLFIS